MLVDTETSDNERKEGGVLSNVGAVALKIGGSAGNRRGLSAGESSGSSEVGVSTSGELSCLLEGSILATDGCIIERVTLLTNSDTLGKSRRWHAAA